MSLQLLIVEDENDLAELVADYARAAGYLPNIIGNGQQALQAVRVSMPDFIVLDLMLPGMDGLSFCKEVRSFSQVPIIMVTAKVEEIDRLIGLESGADDYLCKPFSPRELMARIKVILRRLDTKNIDTRSARKIVINEEKHRISIDGKVLELTRSEYLLLSCFVRHPGQIFSRTQLLDVANQDSLDVTDRAIDTHIKNLRRKLEVVLPDANPIHSIYGLGYRFDL
ncbi:MAG: response regulator [Pseudomonadota bacterium]